MTVLEYTGQSGIPPHGDNVVHPISETLYQRPYKVHALATLHDQPNRLQPSSPSQMLLLPVQPTKKYIIQMHLLHKRMSTFDFLLKISTDLTFPNVSSFPAVAPAMDTTAVADTNDPRAMANAAKVMTVKGKTISESVS
jgi:hypothetical protein